MRAACGRPRGVGGPTLLNLAVGAAVLLVRSNVRRFVSELVRSSLPKVSVLSYGEVSGAANIETHAIVNMED